ncbi:MAG: N-acetylmuramoyl-L-alanine amidase [Gemmatimonadaceae bacterium]|nr:N-acetylmuramoyl-L-alanine amidase [Gemmatimonadaceae bacterium]NUQ91634.1 N-acetylmuramoyl-L-alanine amidase [Gemmatimonadaceae bacterium]
MIAALLLALQLSAPAELVIRSGARVVNVPVTSTAAGPGVRADLLGPALGATMRRLPNGHISIAVGGIALDVAEHLPFVAVGDSVFPLAIAPVLVDGRLVVPLQLLTEILPRVSRALAYDSVRDELRVTDTARVRGATAVAAKPPSSAAAAEKPAAPPARRAQRVVVVDAGHGGPDNGMHGPIGEKTSVIEKDVTLAVAKQLATALRARGLKVIMTRTTDTLIALSDRGRIANASHADLFLSVHVNAANPNWKKPAATRGFETYFLAEAKTEDAKRVEAMENESVKFETGVHAPKGDPLAFIINDMAQNEHLRESSDLAGTVQGTLAKIHPGPDRGVRQANFAVLRTSFMPAVLVEIGFGTNPAEAKVLASKLWQTRIAGAIADATVSYLSRYERRVTTATP